MRGLILASILNHHHLPASAKTSMPEANKTLALVDGQKRVLMMINQGQPLPEILELVCRVVEAQAEGMHASVLLVDGAAGRLLHGAGPTIPKPYNDAIHGIAIGKGIGSCGTAAATGEPVIVEDVSTHPYWANFKDLAQAHGLAACWSTPIKAYGQGGRVLATFAIYHRTPKLPTAGERKLIEFAAHLVTIAVNRSGWNGRTTAAG
jgi:GAF domain-containing protein